ncbi:MAG TPA: hypothetical protein VJS43_02645, partial [Candidatus Acidoferrales bacterium]|nr:hypothetical protein [Candidatus Acidoferrales bacterium]
PGGLRLSRQRAPWRRMMISFGHYFTAASHVASANPQSSTAAIARRASLDQARNDLADGAQHNADKAKPTQPIIAALQSDLI